MLDKEYVVACKDFRLLMREKTFALIFLVFIAMALASAFIGWSSQNTILRVYDATARQLVIEGKSVPPSPFSSLPSLSIMKNMPVYMKLIGALLAIIAGNMISVNDRVAGVTRLIFSRPFSELNLFISKLMSSFGIIVISLMASMAVNIVSVAVLVGLNPPIFFRIVLFYELSFAYLAGFACLSMFFGYKTDNSALAIILPVLVWIAITFAIPEFGSAVYPTNSLNPTLPATDILDSPILNSIHSILHPLSVSEQYMDFSSSALDLNGVGAGYFQATSCSIILAWFAVSLAVLAYGVLGFDASRGDGFE